LNVLFNVKMCSLKVAISFYRPDLELAPVLDVFPFPLNPALSFFTGTFKRAWKEEENIESREDRGQRGRGRERKDRGERRGRVE
jgi:hypothetical protein